MFLYVVKCFGRTHFFKTEQARQDWIDKLPEWEGKSCQLWEVRIK